MKLAIVSDAAIAEIGQRLDITVLDVRNVLTYYSMLRTKPVGKYHVQVCTNISCMLRGGNELLPHCKNRLGIGHKQTTADGMFSLEEVECIGACSWAPAIQVNYDFHDDLTPESLDAVLEEYRSKDGSAWRKHGPDSSPIPMKSKSSSRRFGQGATDIDQLYRAGRI